MNAKDFFNRFIENIKVDMIYRDDKFPELKGKTYLQIYKNNTDFTKLVNRKIIEEILISEYGKDSISHEYFRIDSVAWESHYKDMKNELGLNPHLWDLKIAVEHENSLKDWTDEVIKLIHIKCPLKVIIGYNHCNRRDISDDTDKIDGKSDIAKLDFIAKWMKKVEAFAVGDDEEYLIILGNAQADGTNKKEYVDFDYRGYLYNRETNKFERIYG